MHKTPPTRLLRIRTRFGSNHQAAINERSRCHRSECEPATQRGKEREQKGRRIPVNDHQVNEIDRHPKLVELEPRQQRERDRRVRTTEGPQQSAGGPARARRNSGTPQLSKKAALANRSASVATMTISAAM